MMELRKTLRCTICGTVKHWGHYSCVRCGNTRFDWAVEPIRKSKPRLSDASQKFVARVSGIEDWDRELTRLAHHPRMIGGCSGRLIPVKHTTSWGSADRPSLEVFGGTESDKDINCGTCDAIMNCPMSLRMGSKECRALYKYKAPKFDHFGRRENS